MSITTVKNLDASIHKTNTWLKELSENSLIKNEENAYIVLRAALHAIRDRLPVTEAAHFAAQLPMLVRGFYYEGWRPAAVPNSIESKEEFLKTVEGRLTTTERIDPHLAFESVMELLRNHITPGQIEHLEELMPKELKPLVTA